jgi:WD40 repeat protein
MRYLFALSFIGLVPAASWAQGKKSDEPGPVKVIELKRAEPVAYEKDIETIFYKKCITCHSGSVKESRFDISSYDTLIKGGKRGAALVPGKSDQSLIYKELSRTAKPFMPPAGEDMITPEELALVKLWIDQGAKAPSGQRVRPKIIVGLPPANVTPIRALALSPDKSTVAAGRGNQIHVYDAGSGAFIRALVDPGLKVPSPLGGEGKGEGKAVKAAHMSIVSSMTFSPDSKYLVSGSFQEIAIWDIKTGLLRHKVTGFAHEVVALAFSHDGKLLATGGGAPTEDGEVKVFAAGDWKLLTDVKGGHSDTVYGLCFNPDGKLLATCSADKFIKVWTVPEGKFVKSFEGHTHHVLDVGWMAYGKKLASAGADNTVKVWDYERGEQERTINAHAKQVTRLQFIGKTNQFATCGGDAQVKFFNTGGGQTKIFQGNNDFVYAISVSADGQMVAAGGQEGVARVYNAANAQLLRSLLPPDAAQPPMKK